MTAAWGRLVDQIDLARRSFSLIVLTPKQPFLDWIAEYAGSKGLSSYRVYVPVENDVWIIPPIDAFSEPGSFTRFLDDIKPALLCKAIAAFGAGPDRFGRPVDSETFDVMFHADVRWAVRSVAELS